MGLGGCSVRGVQTLRVCPGSSAAADQGGRESAIAHFNAALSLAEVGDRVAADHHYQLTLDALPAQVRARGVLGWC